MPYSPATPRWSSVACREAFGPPLSEIRAGMTGARLTFGWLGGARSVLSISFDKERSMVGCKGVPTAFCNLKDAELRGHLLTCAMIGNEDQEPL
eukprot:1799931-Pyramimonas_sp.AAC.1